RLGRPHHTVAHRSANSSLPTSHAKRATGLPTYADRTTAPSRHSASGLQLETLEFLPSRPEVAEMVNGRPRRRKRERIELFIQHLLQVVLGCDANRYVWIKFLAARVGYEGLHVVDGRFVDVGVFLRGDERRRGPLLHGERRDGVDQLLLVPDEVVG